MVTIATASDLLMAESEVSAHDNEELNTKNKIRLTRQQRWVAEQGI